MSDDNEDEIEIRLTPVTPSALQHYTLYRRDGSVAGEHTVAQKLSTGEFIARDVGGDDLERFLIVEQRPAQLDARFNGYALAT